MEHMMAGMATDAPLKLGRALILTGFALTVHGLVPRGRPHSDRLAGVRVQARSVRFRPMPVPEGGCLGEAEPG